MITVLLDNGHGVNTPGKRSPDGVLREYKYAREIVKGIYNKLKAEGYTCEILVPEENDISLGERVRRANKYPNAILVSVHLNAAGNGDWMNARGWEVYTSPGQTRADQLATDIFTAAQECLPPETKFRVDMSDGDPDKEARFYILTKSRCPAVLTENLFQDNKQDVEFLLSEAGRNAIIDLHVKGIKRYLSRL